MERLRTGMQAAAEILGIRCKENPKQGLRLRRKISNCAASVQGKLPKLLPVAFIRDQIRIGSQVYPFQVCDRAFRSRDHVLQCFSEVVVSAERHCNPDTITYLRIGRGHQGWTASIAEARNRRITSNRTKDCFDVGGFFGKEVLFFHFGEIRHVNGEARLSQRLGNTNEVDTVFAGRIDAVNDEDRRIRPLSPIHIDRNAGMRNRSMRHRAAPCIQSSRVSEDL